MLRQEDSAASYFARMNFRADTRLFGIKQVDRLLHMLLIGKTGTGKSTVIETLAAADLYAGRGFALVDPHGDLVERVFNRVSEKSRARVTYFNVPDPSQPFGYNPLRRVPAAWRSLAASGVLETFKNIWADAWGVKMEHVLRNALLLLLEQPQAGLPDVLRLLVDREYRRGCAVVSDNAQVKAFWLEEYEGYPQRFRAESIAPIQNKVGAFLADPLLYRILVAPQQDVRIRRIMDGGEVFLVNLAKGRIGEDSSSLLGSLLVTMIGLAAFSRAELPEPARRPFILYIDEFQEFVTHFIASMTSELRKYGVGLVLAAQYLSGISPDIRHAVLGNAGSLVAFRVGADDAAFLAREFQPKFDVVDFLNLANHDIYLRLMIDGSPSKPFSATTLPPRISR